MITVLYSSGGGNTRMVVEYVAQQSGFEECTFINVATGSIDDLNGSTVILLAAPTYDHGVLHKPYERFLDKAKGTSLTKKYAIIGLGDNKYDNEYNVESAPILEEFVKDHGGTLLCESLKINKNPVTQLDTLVKSRVETQFLPSLPKI